MLCQNMYSCFLCRTRKTGVFRLHYIMQKKKRTILAALLIFGIILIDQIIKIEIKTSFSLHESYHITDWFQLLFTENRGMAFGMQFIGTMFLALFRIVAIFGFIFMLARAIKRKAPYGLIVCMSMIIAGALGNLIDNMFYGLIFNESTPYGAPAQLVTFGNGYGSLLSGKVVDMFYFPLFEWPDWMPLLGGQIFFGAIFNFADASISCGAVALALFYYKYITHENIFSLSKRQS